MTGPLRRFADIQAVLVDLFEQFAGVGHTGIETPADLAERLPFIRVVRIGGRSDQLNDFARVDVDTFEATYAAGELLAQQVHQYVTGQRLRSGPVVVDRVDVERAPAELPWAPGIRRLGATYLFVSRRYTSAG